MGNMEEVCDNRMPDLRWCLRLWNIVVEEKNEEKD